MTDQIETTQDKPKRRGTRLKGTDTHRPCVDCGQMKDRLKDFKPRWAGCKEHRTERGRRYHQVGCAACDQIVAGNIRQPRCITCDKARPKRVRKAAAATVASAPAVEAAPVVEAVHAEDLAASPEAQAAVEATLAPVLDEPAVVGLPEPAVESVAVSEPEPAPVQPAPAKRRPAMASLADLAKLFDAPAEDEEVDGE